MLNLQKVIVSDIKTDDTGFITSVKINGNTTKFEGLNDSLKQAIEEGYRELQEKKKEKKEDGPCDCIACKAMNVFMSLLKEDMDKKGPIYQETLDAIKQKLIEETQAIKYFSKSSVKSDIIKSLTNLSKGSYEEKEKCCKIIAENLKGLLVAIPCGHVADEIIEEIIDGKFDHIFV